MRRHLGKARYPAIALIAVVAVALFVRIQLIEKTKATASMLPLMPTASELAVALIRAGLDAETLAAAGVSPNSVGTVVGDVTDHLMTNQTLIELADAAHAQAKQQANQLKRVIQSGRATSEQIDAYPGATLQMSQDRAQCQALVDAVLNAATANVSQAQRDTLGAIQENRNWDLPLEFLVVDRTEPQWVELRDCLANERIAAKLGEAPDAGPQATLAQLRSDPLVAAAKANLDANSAIIDNAWQAAVFD